MVFALGKILPYTLLILVLASCKTGERDSIEEMPPLYPPPRTVQLNLEGGYKVNQFTGDRILPIINSIGDTIRTGVPLPFTGIEISEEDARESPMIPADSPTTIPFQIESLQKLGQGEVHPLDLDDLKRYYADEVHSDFLLVNSVGDTLPTGVPIPCKGRHVPCLQPEPVQALPPRMKETTCLNIRYLDGEQGLNNDWITSLLKDSLGNIWMGMRDGSISCYDGNNLVTYTAREGLIGNRVHCIAADRQGNLWIATNGGVSRFDGEYFLHITDEDGLAHNDVLDIQIDSKNNAWFGTFGGGISKFDGRCIINYTTREGLSFNRATSILEDRQGNIWITSDLGLVNIFDGKSFRHLGSEHKQAIGGLRLVDLDGNVWQTCFEGGIVKFDGKNITTFHIGDETWTGIKVIKQDPSGNFWLGSSNGIIKLDSQNFIRISEEHGLNNNETYSLLFDGQGSIWAGHRMNGISIYKERSFRTFSVDEGLGSNVISTLMLDSRGDLWMGSWVGIFSRYSEGKISHFSFGIGMPNPAVIFMEEDHTGDLWIGTFQQGIWKFNGSGFTQVLSGLNWYRVFINSIIEDRRERMWIAGSNGLFRYEGEKYMLYNDLNGLSGSNINSVLEDSRGDLWFSGSTGASRLSGNTITHYTEAEGLPDKVVNRICEDSQGNLWFGTENGLSCFDGSAFTTYTVKQGLSSNRVFSMMEDGRNNLWIATAEGLDRMTITEKSTTQGAPGIVSHKLQDGLPIYSEGRGNLVIDSLNRLWMASIEGLVLLDLDNFSPASTSPSVRLSQIDINGRFIDYRRMEREVGMEQKDGMEFDGAEPYYNYPLNLELRHDKSHLTFHFSAIDWAAPHKIRYSYRMQGVDEEWSPIAREPKAEYRNLPHGTFTFVVRAIGEAREWSEPFQYTFTIHPPWWSSWPARVAYAIAALLFVFGLVRWRTARLKQRQRELELTVEERTAEITEQKRQLQQQKEEVESQRDEISAQRDEIEAQRDLVSQQKEQISEQKQAMTDSIQYASRIQTAILPPDEVLKYLLPKHFILYRPRDIVSGDFYWLGQKNEKVVIAIADCTGHGVPGAFMSMLGSALLNDVVNKTDTMQADIILNDLRDQVMVSLRQTGRQDEAKDGMDMALCVLDKPGMKLQYAGGFNPLYIIRRGELIELKADKMPVGISPRAGKPFTINKFDLQKGDSLYMFSDGFADQFGGERGKKFMYSRFKKLLLEIQDRIMFEQKEALESELDEWMGLTGLHGKQHEQIDDIIVMGIRI